MAWMTINHPVIPSVIINFHQADKSLILLCNISTFYGRFCSYITKPHVFNVTCRLILLRIFGGIEEWMCTCRQVNIIWHFKFNKWFVNSMSNAVFLCHAISLLNWRMDYHYRDKNKRWEIVYITICDLFDVFFIVYCKYINT